MEIYFGQLFLSLFESLYGLRFAVSIVPTSVSYAVLFVLFSF